MKKSNQNKKIVYFLISSIVVLFFALLIYGYMQSIIPNTNLGGGISFNTASFLSGFILIMLTVLCFLFAPNLKKMKEL